jgi:hypothetical protein
MDSVQNCDGYNNIPSSQTYRSYLWDIFPKFEFLKTTYGHLCGLVVKSSWLQIRLQRKESLNIKYFTLFMNTNKCSVSIQKLIYKYTWRGGNFTAGIFVSKQSSPEHMRPSMILIGLCSFNIKG